MWTLFLFLLTANPIILQVDGFTSLKWCESVASELVETAGAGPVDATTSCVKLPG